METKLLLFIAASAGLLFAQESSPSKDGTPEISDPFRTGGGSARGGQNNDPQTESNGPPISICTELFSLSLKDAADLRREQLSDSELYLNIINQVEEGSAKQENLTILRGRFGETVTTESIVEEIYPTEYLPAEVLREEIIAPPLATAFETRNTGFTMEFLAKLNDDQSVSILYAPEMVNRTEDSMWGNDDFKTTMPTFESQRIRAGLKLTLGKPSLAGTMNRPPQSIFKEDAANEVWFAFITVSLVKP